MDGEADDGVVSILINSMIGNGQTLQPDVHGHLCDFVKNVQPSSRDEPPVGRGIVLLNEAIDFGRHEEVAVGQAAGVVRSERERDRIVRDEDIRMMILFLRDPRDGVGQIHGVVEGVALHRSREHGHIHVGHPVGNLGQSRFHLARVERRRNLIGCGGRHAAQYTRFGRMA